jgi:uncharacterized protein (DUF2345 family)
MGKKSGKAGGAVPPAAPKKAEDADIADPGKVAEIKAEQAKTKSGKYGSEKVKPHKPPQTKEEKQQKKSWIEIQLEDEEGNPIPGKPYRIKLSDNSVIEGTLDGDGYARVDGIDPGDCEVTFPDDDEETIEDA